MPRYVITFSKQGLIKYTSHLDMVRLFKRAFNRSGIYLEYSNGFNPHPKMVFAQPLALGYTSEGELLEFDTRDEYDADDIRNMVNKNMPSGIRVLRCVPIEKEKNLLRQNAARRSTGSLYRCRRALKLLKKHLGRDSSHSRK